MGIQTARMIYVTFSVQGGFLSPSFSVPSFFLLLMIVVACKSALYSEHRGLFGFGRCGYDFSLSNDIGTIQV